MIMNQNGFFTQSESDALKDFEDSCRQSRDGNWDWIVLTAANAHQAETYRIQLEKRRLEHRLPLNTQFLVVPDFEDKRVGSGGATLNVLRELAQRQRPSQIFEQRILVIHSGGDSKRIPQYSACGKLFAPVPRAVLGGYVSTLFDELLMSAINIPSRTGHGMLILPSDTKLLFNAVQIDLLSCDAAGLSMKAPVSVGQEHGVFVQGEHSFDHRNRNVSLFLHKQPEAFLRMHGAVDISNQVDIDTGCIWLGKRVVKALFDLISGKDGVDDVRFRQFVNPRVCLNFYADMVYPLAENSSWEEFAKEAPENGFSQELEQCRRELWEKLHPFRLSLVKLVPAQYIHFGMTHEMYDLYVNDIASYRYLSWQRRMNTNAVSGTVLNSIVENCRMIVEQAYIENCRLSDCNIGEGVILSHVDIRGESIPPSVVLHGLKLTSGKYVCRIYGRNDNPKSSKESSFLKGTLSKLIAMTGVREDEIWGNASASLWYARIYPICDTMAGAVRAALDLYDILVGSASAEKIGKWKNALKTSLADSFLSADIEAILNRQDEIQTEVHIKQFMDDLTSGRDMRECIDVLGQNVRDKGQCLARIVDAAKSAQFPHNMRLYLAASKFCQRYPGLPGSSTPQSFEDDAYACIKQCVTEETYARFGIRPEDAGNGAAGFFATQILKPLGADISGSVFLEPDGHFPNYVPNPEDETAMAAAKQATLDAKADLGVIFDCDGDRGAVVFRDGTEVNRNTLIALLSAIVAETSPHSTIVTDSVTSDELAVYIEQKLGMKHLRYKRGYKNVIDKAIELNQNGEIAELAIETSGHGAFKENYFSDDGAYVATKIICKGDRKEHAKVECDGPERAGLI